jgi:4-amino-4-deoxy-L-arabinose transferase-like glycosyltransferase
MEFPLLHALTALVWRNTGHSEPLGRLIPIAFSVASIWLMYLLGTRLFGRPTGRAAAFLLAFSPTYVYFGRTLMSDVPMMCFSIGAVLAYAAYFFGEGRRPHAIAGAICLALAGLTKVPAILVLGPIVWIAWLARRWRLLNDPWFAGGVTAALGSIALWYLHADRIYLETGLTQAIFRPSGTYTGELASFAGPFTTVSHWTDLSEPRMEVQLYAILERFWELHLTPVGFIGASTGLCLAWFRRRTIVDVWFLAGLALVMVSIPGQFNHEFHQLPLLAPLALYFGMAASPLFDGARLAGWIRARTLRAVAPLLATIAWGAIAFMSFAESPIFIALYRPNHLNLGLVDAGRAIDAATPREALFVTVEYDRFGTNSPMLLYYAHRKGWSFDATAMRVVTVQYLQQWGACYVATSHWSMLDAETTAYLLTLREIALPKTHREYRLFELGCQ